MRKSNALKWTWLWALTGNSVMFRNSQGGEFVRYGYQHSDAQTFTDYLNSR